VSVAGKVTAVSAPASASTVEDGHQSNPDSPGTGAAAVEVTVEVADQKALGSLATAPVDVRYVAQERKAVLTVPVDALLALAEGGYGVEVTEPAGTRIVPVQVGLFAGGRVEVTGGGLAEGARVGVPE
jgi:multidrug efflux pump subunit AcrA (membrane-fusion protein)